MKLIVLSIDALGSADLDKHPKLMPNIHKIIKQSALIKNVETIMPSLTYPIHTTIISGQYPSVHGIDHNLPFAPFDNYHRWNWYYDYIKCETLIDAVNQHKKTVTSVFWPVTAGAKIKNCIPEIWDYKTGHAKASLLFKTGTPLFLLKSIKHRKLLDGKNTTKLDAFTIAVLKDLIATNLTDLSLIHLLAIDGAKHSFGIESKECMEAIKQTDEYVGEIFELVKANDDISLVILSDHSQIDSPNIINLEEIFKSAGLLFEDDYIAYPRSCDGSCYVHLKDLTKHEEVKAKLTEIIENTKGLDKLYDLTEIDTVSSEASFTIGVLPGYCVSKAFKYLGQHGHDPKYGHNVFMIVNGKNIKKDFVIDGGHIINHASTFARILDVEYTKTKGECIDEIFESI